MLRLVQHVVYWVQLLKCLEIISNKNQGLFRPFHSAIVSSKCNFLSRLLLLLKLFHTFNFFKMSGLHNFLYIIRGQFISFSYSQTQIKKSVSLKQISPYFSSIFGI